MGFHIPTKVKPKFLIASQMFANMLEIADIHASNIAPIFSVKVLSLSHIIFQKLEKNSPIAIKGAFITFHRKL